MFPPLVRHLLTFVTLLSLSLCLVLVSLWYSSRTSHRTIEYPWRGQHWQAAAFRGRVVFDNLPQGRLDQDNARRAIGRWIDDNEHLLGPWRDRVEGWRGGAWSMPDGVAGEIAQATAGTRGLRPPPRATGARPEGGQMSLTLPVVLTAVAPAAGAAWLAATWRRRRRAVGWRRTGRCRR